MSDTTACIADPLTSIEYAVLRAYVEGDAAKLASAPAGWPDAAAALHDRGMLGRTERGVPCDLGRCRRTGSANRANLSESGPRLVARLPRGPERRADHLALPVDEEGQR